MPAESPTNGPDRSELEQDAVIEAEAIFADAQKRLRKLEEYIDKIPLQEAVVVEDLAQVFAEAGQNLIETYEKISAGGEIDRESTLFELRKYSEALVRAETAIYGLTSQLDTVPPEDEPDTVPAQTEAVPTPNPTPKEVEAEEVKQAESIKSTPPRKLSNPQDQDRLVNELFDNTTHNFLLTEALDGGRRKKKKLADLREDIKLVFTVKGVPMNAATAFFNTQFRVQKEEIGNLVGLLETEKDKNKIDEYRSRINAAYEQIREDVIAEVMTAEGKREESSKDEETLPLQRDLESIKSDIDTARFYLEELRARHKDTEGFLDSAEYKKVQNIFELIDNCADPDSNILNQKLEKYLGGLWPALNELTDKFSVGAGIQMGDKTELDIDLDNERAQAFLNGVEVVELDEIPHEEGLPVLEEKSIERGNTGASEEKNEQRKKWLEAQRQFRDTKKQYHQALEAHQKRSLLDKLRSLGFKPEMPEALKALETEYLERRKVYARELDATLTERGQKFELSHDDMKRAFVRKFILRPQEEILKLQERNLLSPEAKKKLKRIAGKLVEHKWTVRAGTIALAGVAGALTGGTALAFAGAASMQGVKIAGSAAVGTIAGTATNVLTQKFVDKTSANLQKVTEGAEKNFDLDKLDGLDTDILKAAKKVATAKKAQAVATVAAGGIAGFAAGSSFADAVPTGGVTQPDGVPTELGEQAPEQPETSKIVPKVVETPDVLPRPVFMERIILPFTKGELTLFEHHIKDLSFGPEFKPAALSEPETKELASFIKLKSDDFLAPHPNISEANLGMYLQVAVEKKFGGASWWAESPIKSIDIGKIESVLLPDAPSTTIALVPAMEPETVNRLQVSPELIRGEYLVQKGDTLWGIAKEQFADQLKHLSPQEQNAVLSRLFEKVEENPFLLESLNLRSGTDIDRIYAGEKIELSGLQAELASELEKREIIEQFRKSAPLPIEADAEVKSVPITVVEKPVVVAESPVPAVEAAASIGATGGAALAYTGVNKLKAIKNIASQDPKYRTETKELFGNLQSFEVAVDRAVNLFDSKTYDVFDALSNYESPYTLLRDMSVADFDEFRRIPNAELREFLKEKNVKYETYLAWSDKIDELRESYKAATDATVGDLFKRSVREAQAAKNAKTK